MVYEESDTDIAGGDAAAAVLDLFHRRPVALGVLAELAGREPTARSSGGRSPAGDAKAWDLMERQVGAVTTGAFQVFTTSATTTGAVQVEDGRSEHRLSHLRERPRESAARTDRRATRACRSARSRSSTPRRTWDAGGGQLPRHQLSNLPRSGAVLDGPAWQLIRYPNMYASIAATTTSWSASPRYVRRVSWASCCSGAARTNHLRIGAPLFHQTVGLRAFMDFQDPRGTVARDTAILRSSRPGQAQDHQAENLLRLHGNGPRRREARASASPRGSSSGGKPGRRRGEPAADRGRT